LRRRILIGGALASALTAAALFAATAGPAQTGPVVPDPAGIINLPAGYTYTVLSTSCVDNVQSTESGATFPMPEDFDGNVLFNAGDEFWLLSNHELTQPRQGDFQGDAGKCNVPEQTPGDDDSDGWGSISRLVLAKDGTTVLRRELITTGLHNLCAVAETPWKTYLTNEEFPFINDPDQRSGWAWEVDPETGDATRLTAWGRYSHEQMAYAADGSWYSTDDRGDARFVYKFVPDRRTDLTSGELYGLAFNKATMTGTWIGPLNPADPDADMRARGFQPSVWGFVKIEGIVSTAGSHAVGGNALVMSESGAGADPGRIWRFTQLGGDTIRGEILVEGDWARLARPDNLRMNDAGDVFFMEDHSSGDFAQPGTGNMNEIWVLPRGEEGAANLILFATLPNRTEPTGPWFSFDNKLLYLSVQADPPLRSRVIAIRHPGNFNQPYDR
jgi:secreted PhoX family phosphatase